MTPEQTTQLEELTRFMNSLKSANTIPLPIDQAFKGRFGLPQTSTKSATSENQAVNEGGGSTYSVLKAPDAFVQISISGALYYIPVFT